MITSCTQVRSRRGYHLMELIGAIALVGAAMVLVQKLIVATARLEKSERERTSGLVAADAMLARLSALPWESLDASAQPVREIAQSLGEKPGREAEVAIDQVPGEPGLKSIAVTIRFDRPDRGAPIRLRTLAARRPRGAH